MTISNQWYWAQPDADERGRWVVCMNPSNPVIIVDRLDREVAEKTAETMLKAHGDGELANDA